MSTSGGLALALTRRSVRLYTGGLPHELRDERRAELESDVWEESSGGGRTVAILGRCVRGIPADMSWRLEQARPGPLVTVAVAALVARAESTGHWISDRGLPAVVVLLSWLYLLAGTALLLTLPWTKNPEPAAVGAFACWCLLAGGLMWWGHRALPRRPWRGAAAILAGAVPIGLALWMTIVAPLVTLVITVHSVGVAVKNRSPRFALGSYLPIIIHGPVTLYTSLARGVHRMAANVLAIGESLLRPAPAGAPTPGSRAYLLRGAAAGLVIGALARVWMRTISNDPVFTPVGTTLVLTVFTVLGALAGLSLSWRRFGTARRKLVVRAAAWAPFLLMGPFMVLFLPGLALAVLRSGRRPGRRVRRLITWGAWAALAFFTLVFLGADRGPGLVAAGLYLVLAWSIYFTNRIALGAAGGPMALPEQLARAKPNHAPSAT